MLALEGARVGLMALPLLVRLGLAVGALGGFADLVAHASIPASSGVDAHTAAQLSAHLVAFAGMVLVLVGVVVDGVRQSRARRNRRRA